MPTKKVAEPKVTKSAAPKKAASSGRKSLIFATEPESFWTSNGQILNSLVALRDAFAAMSKSVFDYHVTKNRNDFAQWVETVLKDTACATDLRKAKTAASARTVVVRHLKLYQV